MRRASYHERIMTEIKEDAADPTGDVVKGVGMRQLPCWDYWLESRRRHGCLSFVSVVCCQVEFPATGRSLVQSIPTECGIFDSMYRETVIKRPWPSRGCRAKARRGGRGDASLFTPCGLSTNDDVRWRDTTKIQTEFVIKFHLS